MDMILVRTREVIKSHNILKASIKNIDFDIYQLNLEGTNSDEVEMLRVKKMHLVNRINMIDNALNSLGEIEKDLVIVMYINSKPLTRAELIRYTGLGLASVTKVINRGIYGILTYINNHKDGPVFWREVLEEEYRALTSNGRGSTECRGRI